jgi:hypothetical protein
MDIRRRTPAPSITACLCGILVTLALILAGCGAQTGGAGLGSAATSQAGASATSTAPAAPAATSGAAAGPSTATPSSGAAGQPQLILSAARFGPADDISLTVRNGARTTIYAEAQFTDCSIIVIERAVASGWQPINLCAGGNPHPTVTQLASGAQAPLDLAPSAAGSGALAESSGQWPAGTYRAALTYTTNPSAAFSAGATIYSPTFVIG